MEKDNGVKSISVIFLCYNDEKTIGGLVEEAVNILQDLVSDYEVIVVNDGSTDGSYRILENLAGRYLKFKAVHHAKNRGYGAAIKSGFRASTKELIFYTDGDGQYDVKEIVKLLTVIDEADVVNGFLYRRADPVYRIILGKIYQVLLYGLLKIKVRHVDCDFRLFKKKVIDAIDLESDGGFVCAEMIKKIADKGYKIKEIPVQHYRRKNGRSRFFNIKNIYGLITSFIKFYATYR